MHFSGVLLPKIEAASGTVRMELKKCGRANCRCRRGARHGPYYYFYWREDGRLRKLYLRREEAVQLQLLLSAQRKVRPKPWSLQRELAALNQMMQDRGR
jgi:hypothetical protein